jgi:hypothetical protein
MILRGWIHTLGLTAALTLTLQGADGQQKPNINEKFPIRSGEELSPPIVSPVGECAKAVHVSGFIPHAIVRVFVNGTPAGSANPYFAEADIAVSPALKLGDAVTATQEVLGLTSSPSAPPMIVGPYPANLNKPNVLQPLYACGRVVPVDNLNPGTVVDVYRNGGATPIGEANVTQPWTPVVTASLNQPDMVSAVQTACPNDPGKKKVSPTSAAVPVNAAPNPPSPPTVENYPVGADAVVLDGLFVGADLKVTDNSAPVGGGLAAADYLRLAYSRSTVALHVERTGAGGWALVDDRYANDRTSALRRATICNGRKYLSKFDRGALSEWIHCRDGRRRLGEYHHGAGRGSGVGPRG